MRNIFSPNFCNFFTLKLRFPVVLIALLALFYPKRVNAQNLNKSCQFISPVKHNIISSGSFGEPRSAHFHSGVDIKPFLGEGKDPIVAIADGYISRIRITPESYGKSLYIDHPCGYTSVYAHLHRFTPVLSAYAQKVRIATKKSILDQAPPPQALKVQKGDTIGYMGNSGNSFGAHLHFEVRSTASEVPINPVLFGIGPHDNIAPVIRGVMVYYMDSKRTVLHKAYHSAVKRGKNRYSLVTDTLKVDWSLIGIGLHTYDTSNGAGNHNGIHAVQYSINGKNQFSFALDSVSFDHSNYIHAHMDYERKVNNKYVHKCFSEPQSILPIYSTNKTEGLTIPNTQIADHISIATQDVKGNHAVLHFPIMRSIKTFIPAPTINKGVSISPFDSTVIKKNEFTITVKKGSILHNTRVVIDSIHRGIDTRTLELTPFFKPFHISTLIPSSTQQRDKFVFVSVDRKENLVNLGGKLTNKNTLEIDHNELGKVWLFKDIIAPKIRFIGLSYDRIKFQIKDDLKPGNKPTRIQYQAHLNGQWVPLDYDQKNDLLEFIFDKKPSAGSILKVQIQDFSKNTGEYTYKF